MEGLIDKLREGVGQFGYEEGVGQFGNEEGITSCLLSNFMQDILEIIFTTFEKVDNCQLYGKYLVINWSKIDDLSRSKIRVLDDIIH